MGVHGLWKLLESTGRPVNLESLEGKVLAIDVSIWLNQAILGVHGQNLSNPHLQVLFNRICKLLFYRIKPVFVFDGIPPQLKKQTLAARRQRKELAAVRSEKTAERIVKNYLKSHAVRTVMGENGEEDSQPLPMLQIPRKNETDLYELPPMPSTSGDQENSFSEDEGSPDAMDELMAHQEELVSSFQDLTQVDIHCESFKALPVEVQHELITEMQETSKRSSWARVHQLPKTSHDFSSYQMKKLLMKSKLSLRLGDLRKEMRTKMSLTMAALLDAENQKSEVDAGRVASEDAQHYILMKKDQRPKDDWEEEEESKKAVMLAYGEKAGFSTSMDLQMAKTVRKRTAVAMETRSSPSTLRESEAILIGEDDSSLCARKRVKGEGFSQEGTMHAGSSERGEEENKESVQIKDDLVREQLKNFFEQHQPDVSLRTVNCQADSSSGNRSSSSMIKSKLESVEENQDAILTGNREFPMTMAHKSEVVSVESDNDHSDTEDIILLSKSFPRGPSDIFHKDSYDDLVSSGKISEHRKGTLKSDDDQELSIMEKDRSSNEIMLMKSEEENKTNIVVTGRTNDAVGGLNGPDISLTNQDTSRTKEAFELICSEQQNDSTQVEVGHGPGGISKATEILELPVDEIITMEPESRETVPEQEEATEGDGDEDDFVEVQDLPVSSPYPSWTTHTQQAVQAALRGDNKPEADSVMDNLQESDQEPDLDEWQGADLENMRSMNEDLENERRVLEMERRKHQKKASSVSDTMYAESKELLQCFGLPYIDSPQEAEAQCAFLDLSNQTEGTITDDSDIWLFGGRRVYKSFFSKKRDPEVFAMEDIERQLLLERSKLINLAYLMGSDYTLGIQGVGYVTAMELLNEFKGQGLDSLKAFKEWWSSIQEQQKPSAVSLVKRKLKKLTVPEDFPNPLVSKAYLSPVVDYSEDPFQWGIPDLDLIREFARERLGWMKSKVDENLLPVLKRLNERRVQSTMTSFFGITQHGDRKKITSKRIKKVLQKMGRSPSKEEEEEEENRVDGQKKKKNRVGEGKGKRKRLIKKKDDAGEERKTIGSIGNKKKMKVTTARIGGKQNSGKVVKKRKRQTSRPVIGERAELRRDNDSESESLYSSTEDDSDTSSEDNVGQGRRDLSKQGKSARHGQNTVNRDKRQVKVVDYHEDDNEYFSDQDLIEIAESLEMSARMKRARGGHSLTTDLRNVGHGEQEPMGAVSQVGGCSWASGTGQAVPTLGRGRGQRGRGKGVKAGTSRKGKTLVKTRTEFSGPNLSTSGSDSD